jgi:hypothetical protein
VKALEEQIVQVDDTLERELDRIADALELQNQLLAQIAGRLWAERNPIEAGSLTLRRKIAPQGVTRPRAKGPDVLLQRSGTGI